MPRYFFDVHDGSDLPDHEGTELPDLTAARRHAVEYAASCLFDAKDTFWQGGDWSMDVKEEGGIILFTLHFMATRSPSTMNH